MTVHALQALASQGDERNNVNAVLALQNRAMQGDTEAFKALLTSADQANVEAVFVLRQLAREGYKAALYKLQSLATQGYGDFCPLEPLPSLNTNKSGARAADKRL